VENDACSIDAIQLVAEYRARVDDGKFVCMPCAGEYGRGW
jgi:formylmethanofuran dehydrogenase subunit E